MFPAQEPRSVASSAASMNAPRASPPAAHIPGADAYILSRVLFNWDDDDAVAILRNCRQAMAPGGRVLVMEPVIPPGNEASLAKLID